MKRIYLLTFLLLNFGSFSQTFGSFASGIKINNTIYNNTASASIHNINQNSGAQNFNGVNLGTFGVNSTCGIISGAEVKTFKNTTANVCGSKLFWRVYPSISAPSGIFNSITLPTVTNCNIPTGTFNDGFGPCATGDQKWKDYTLTSNFVTGLTAGTYILEIYFDYTGSNNSPIGCELNNFINNAGSNFKANFTISNPICAPTATPNPICEGSVLTLTANPSNGVAPYTYNWTGPNSFTSSNQNPTITTTLNSSGVYSLIVTDACGVSSTVQNTQSVVINTKIVPEFDAINPGLCKLGTPPILPNLSTNGINGTWNPATVNNSTVGTFNYVFTPDSGECATSFTQTIFVINNVNPTFTLPASICQGSTPPVLQNNSNNGIQGTWSPTTISNAATATYTFTPNTGQCANVKNVTITVVPNVTPTFTLPSSICENSTPPVLPTTSNNGINGTWNPSTVNNTATGTYVFTHSPSQCATNLSVTITVNPNVIPTFNPIASICENATPPVLPTTSTNGITGTWNPSTVSNTASGTYNFTPTVGLCALPTSINVTVNPNILPTFDPIPNVCYLTTPPSLATTSTNGYSGTWNPSIISNTTSGTYTFTPTAGLCALVTTLNVTVNIITPTFNTVPPICSGGSVPNLQTTSNNGITGSWNPQVISNTTSGTYTFTPSPNQCATTLAFSVTVNPIITPTFNDIAPVCQNSPAPNLQTTSNNGVSGTWNPTSIDTANAGTFSFTFTPDAGFCATTKTISVVIKATILPTFTIPLSICENAIAPILPSTSNNNISGIWSPSTVSNSTTGTYTFTPPFGNTDCALPITITITVNPIVTPTFNPIPNVCYLTTAPILPLTSTNGITGTWNPSTVSNTASGTYTFTPNAGECGSTTTINVTVTVITPTFNTVPQICSGGAVPNLQTTSNNGITGTWNPSTINNTTSGTYTFTPSPNQCATTLAFSVTVNPTTVPTFNAIAPVCQNSVAPNLQNPSNNGISGTWNPLTIDTSVSGTFSYTFTPDAGFCATTKTIDVVINPFVTPTFNPIGQICQNGNVPTLQTISNNGITGTWNPSTINNTTVGTTTYIFTPNSNQCASSKSVDIEISPNVTPTFDSFPPVCSGTTPPALPLTSNNGISGTWNPSGINNTTSGTYTFTPNANQCAVSTSINIIVSPNIVPSFNAIPDVCYQTSAPNLETTSTNGITGTWNPSTISNTASGSYTFTPSPNQCATTTTLNVIVTIITPTFTAVPPVCFNAAPPSLPTTSNNGITGNWNPLTIDTTTAGTYTFTPDANQCAPIVSITTTINSITPTFNAIPAVCYGTTAPNLQTTSSNGIIGIWNPSTIDNTTSGTYTFTPDANQCATTATLNVTVTTITPTFTIASTICENATPPTLPTTSNNGITGTWNPSIVSNSTSNTYTFTPNANQCAPTVSITVTVNPNVVPTFNDIPPVCYNASVPTLSTTSNNGISGTWNPSVVSNLASNTYTFTPTFGICATPISITIIVNTINPTFDTIPNVCYGSTAPTLQTISNNGITGSWNPSTISNTVAGTYTFTPDANQCATTASLSVGINTVTPTFTIVSSICENATAPTLATTSDNAITGSWNPSTVNNTTSGTYTFTPDANQCAPNVTVTIIVNPIVTPTFDPITPVCYNSTAPILSLISTNGISGTWNPATVSNTNSGTYTFTPNSGECGTVTTITINVNTINPSFASFTTTSICENSTAPTLPLTSDNAIAGTWNPSSVSNTMTDTYTFTPNANQCATTTSLIITVNPNVVPVFNAVPAICYNSIVPLLPTTSNNGIQGVWNPSVINNTTPATYTFTPNAGICATIISITTTINTITPTFNSIAPVCYNSTAPTLQTTSNNGITGSWSPTLVNNLAPADYTFTPDANQCATPLVVSIAINVVTPTFNAIAPVCYNATPPTLNTTSTNGITGTWNPTIVSNLVDGTYTFTPDANQCAVVITVPITVNKIVPAFTSFTTTTICANTTAPILPTTSDNGIIGSWNSLVSNTTSATYTFTPNPNQCATIATLSITVTARTIPTFSIGLSAAVCQSTNTLVLPITSANGYGGNWNPTTVDYSILGTTIYTFTPNANECATTTTYSVTVNVNVTPIFTAIAPLCSGSTAPILPSVSSNGFTGTWNPSTVSVTNSGNYIFTPTAGQCATSFTMPITVYQSPTDLTVLASNVFNQSSTGVLEITGVTSGVSPYLYSLDNGSFTNQTTYTNLAPGTYSLTVKDANGCEFEKMFTIESNCIFPNGISPNGDGKNDTFNLGSCNVKRLELFNRYGTRINVYDNYLSQWDGTTSDGKELPDGTYFYTAEISDGTTKTGWVYLVRKN